MKMLQKYIIYFSLKESCDVYFSPMYSSFNKAKQEIDNFLKDFAKKRGKKVIIVSKDELEKLKVSKKPEDCFYVRRKNSQAVVYNVNISQGAFYNSYSIEKYGKINVNEFIFQTNKEEKVISEEKIADLYVTNQERGTHISFLSELKDVINKREKKEVNFHIEPKEKDESKFILSLKEGKKTLRNVSSPVIRKHF